MKYTYTIPPAWHINTCDSQRFTVFQQSLGDTQRAWRKFQETDNYPGRAGQGPQTITRTGICAPLCKEERALPEP